MLTFPSGQLSYVPGECKTKFETDPFSWFHKKQCQEKVRIKINASQNLAELFEMLMISTREGFDAFKELLLRGVLSLV